MKYKLNIAVWVFGAIASVGLYLYISSKALPFSEPWIKYGYQVKDYINSKDDGRQRLIVIGGSSTMFGFNGEIFDKATPFRLINYGIHVTFPMEYIVDKIILSAKRGDIIFLPLEFDYYIRGNFRQDPYPIQFTMQVGMFKFRTLDDIFTIKMLLQSTPNQIIKRLDYTLSSKDHYYNGSDDVIKNIEQIWQEGNKVECVHIANYKLMDRSGSLVNCNKNFVKRTYNYIRDDFAFSENFLKHYARLQKWADKNNVKVFFTYPPIMRAETFDLYSQDAKLREISMARAARLKSQFKEHGIEIYGDIKDFNFEKKYFFDTAYHLNSDGAVLRTVAFVQMLKDMNLME